MTQLERNQYVMTVIWIQISSQTRRNLIHHTRKYLAAKVTHKTFIHIQLCLKKKQSSVETSKDDTSMANPTDRQETDSTNEASISVLLAKSYTDGKKVVEKYHACTYCRKLILRIARHVQSVHKDESYFGIPAII